MVPMEALGFTEGFDAVYGSSAGALNGAYLLANQAAFGASVYYRDVANRRFVNFLRPRKVLDMDFVFDDVVGRRSRLDVARVRSNRTPLHVVLTDARTGEELVHSSHEPGIDLLAALKASAAVPILYGRPVALNGSHYVDGSLVDPLPVERAIRDGCTDILVVLTVPRSYRVRPPGTLERRVVRRWLEPVSPALVEAWFRRHEATDRALHLIEGRAARQKAGPVNIVAVFPHPSRTVSAFTIDARRLKRAALDAAWRTMRLFSEAPCRPAELIQFVSGEMGFDTGL
jgi:predicted patatin/cPLA2 family phospholipase